MAILSYIDFRLLFSFYYNKKSSSEYLRFIEGVDIDISDKKTKKKSILINSSDFFTKKINTSTNLNPVKGRMGLISLINSLQKLISAKNLLKNYPQIKEDLIDIVQFKEKDRILILIKGKNIGDLLIFPFSPKFWIKSCTSVIISWHKI